MTSRRKQMADLVFAWQDGFSGTGAVDDAVIAATDTVMGVDALALRDDRLIVPVGARFTTAGIPTVREVTASQNSQQYVVTVTATGGTFTITLNSETTAAIAFGADSATIQAAIELLASVSAGDVTVTGDGPHTITMAGDLANVSTNVFTVDDTNATGGSVTSSTTQDGTTTWEVTFTPAIASGSVPNDDDVITWLPRRLNFKTGTGNFEFDITREPIIDRDRGKIDSWRKGDEQAVTVEGSALLDWLRASGNISLTTYEVLTQEGAAADWLASSHGDVCNSYAPDLVVIDAPDCGSELAEVMVFPMFIPTSLNPNVDDGLINLSGIAVAVKPIIKRVANNQDAIDSVY